MMTKKYVLTKDLAKLEGKKGILLETKGNISLVKTEDIYTVWNHETGFHFTNTYYIEEAVETYTKHTKQGE